ncbi:MAG: acyl-CoA thioesterase [Spirochaetaceae bacterium]|nr:MAG: acyl-CoA thioesterase [Spirochaetaceae bacterium]
MDTFTLVRPGHLNHFGYLFGGQLLKWVDESAWLYVTRTYPEKMFVTRAMNNVEFKTRVESGSILRFLVTEASQGQTSLTCSVKVLAQYPKTSQEKEVFSNEITFVRINEDGEKIPL